MFAVSLAAGLLEKGHAQTAAAALAVVAEFPQLGWRHVVSGR